MTKAEKLYREFYELRPNEKIKVRLPDLEKGIATLVCLGRALRVDYESDKWERPRKYKYKHTFKKLWYVYTDENGRFLVLLPNKYGKKIVRSEGIID